MIKKLIRDIKDFPKEGIIFRDITPLLSSPEGLKETIDNLAEQLTKYDVDAIAGVESRGFIFGTALAYKLGKGFIPIRKKGKLPYKTISEKYELEYGSDYIEIHEDAVKNGDKILLIDDLLATGGTAEAAAKLIEKTGGIVSVIAFVLELSELNGAKKIEKYNKVSLVTY